MKRITRIMAISLVVAMLTVLLSSVAYGVGSNLSLSGKEQNQRLVTLFCNTIDAVKDDSQKLQLSVMKTVKDFAGNSYIVAEFQPTGYAIFNVATGIFTEYSALSDSPYLGYSENELYYAGMAQFYAKQGSKIVDLLTKESAQEQEVRALFAPYSKQQFALLEKNRNDEVAQYVSKKISNYVQPKAVTEELVLSANRLIKLRDPGERKGGVCGYIAAAMLLYYYRSSGRRNITSATDYETDANGYYKLKKDLVNYLVDTLRVRLGLPIGSHANTIKTLLSEYIRIYCNRVGVSQSGISHNTWYAPTTYQIEVGINNDKPVIIFAGLLSSAEIGITISHAVLAYGYKYNFGTSDEMIVHYGYVDRSKVYVTGAWGSIYTLTC